MAPAEQAVGARSAASDLTRRVTCWQLVSVGRFAWDAWEQCRHRYESCSLAMKSGLVRTLTIRGGRICR